MAVASVLLLVPGVAWRALPRPPCPRGWTSRQRRTPTSKSWSASRSCSSRSASNSATPRATSGWPWARCTGTTSRRRPSRGSRRSTSPSRTCASSSPSWPSGSRTRTRRTTRPRTRPRCSPQVEASPPQVVVYHLCSQDLQGTQCQGGGRRGPPLIRQFACRLRGRSMPTRSRPRRKSRTWPTASAWRRRWWGYGSAIGGRRRSGWIRLRISAPQGRQPRPPCTPSTRLASRRRALTAGRGQSRPRPPRCRTCSSWQQRPPCQPASTTPAQPIWAQKRWWTKLCAPLTGTVIKQTNKLLWL